MKKEKSIARLTVVARAPFKVYYEGPAKVVSALNLVGKFDVLPGHADFFSVMNAGDVEIETDTELIKFGITGGVIGVKNDEVMLFVNM